MNMHASALAGLGASSHHDAERQRRQVADALDAADPVDVIDLCLNRDSRGNASDCACDASNVADGAAESLGDMVLNAAEAAGEFTLNAAASAGEFALNAAGQTLGNLIDGI